MERTWAWFHFKVLRSKCDPNAEQTLNSFCFRCLGILIQHLVLTPQIESQFLRLKCHLTSMAIWLLLAISLGTAIWRRFGKAAFFITVVKFMRRNSSWNPSQNALTSTKFRLVNYHHSLFIPNVIWNLPKGSEFLDWKLMLDSDIFLYFCILGGGRNAVGSRICLRGLFHVGTLAWRNRLKVPIPTLFHWGWPGVRF